MNVGLRNVIEHERLIRQSLSEDDRGRKLARVDQDVVGEPEFGKLGDAANEIFASQKSVVRLGLRNVTKSAKFWKSRKVLEAFAKIGREKIDPADHTFDELVSRCEIEQEFRFVLGLIGLHCDGSVDLIRGYFRREIGRSEIALQHGHAIVDPGIARRIVVPEVLMRIDPHHGYRKLKKPPSMG
jgi:hypothetical protein